MVVLLNRRKAVKLGSIVDRETTLERYDNTDKYVTLLKGMPLLVNVDGSYVKAYDIPQLLHNKEQSVKVNDWLSELKRPIGLGSPVTFMWVR